MKTKYFRFLYCERNSCMVHFGELTDTLTREQFAFMFISGMQRKEDAPESGKTLFLCPKQVDLVVMGDANEQTDHALKEVLEQAEVKQLVLPESNYCWKTDFSKIKKQVYLLAESEMAEGKQTEKNLQKRNSLMVTAAGWRFFMKSYGEGSVAMAHSLDGNPGLFSNILEKKEENQRWENPFEDCVMNVKALDHGEKCCCQVSPDSYACAMGCALKKDSDLCRYQRARTNGAYLTGAVLFGNSTPENAFGKMENELGAWMEEMRFFLIPGRKDEHEARRNPLAGRVAGHLGREYKRYYIGMKECADETLVKEICVSGMHQILKLLGDGDGICCSGLLKYADQ